MFNNILVVCVANICRSPTGERLLKSLLPEKSIASAGINCEKSRMVGKPADSMACSIAQQNNLGLSGHLAQQLTAEMCNQYDLILVMEKKHIEAVTQIAPQARGKTMLFNHWAGKDIPDPYRQSHEAFEHVYQLMSEAALAWKEKL